MTDFNREHTFVAGAKVKADEHNDNWDALEDYLNNTGVQVLQATKIQTKRVAFSGGDSSEFTVTWDTPFADTNYTVSIDYERAGTSENPIAIKIKSRTASEVVLRRDGSWKASDGVTFHLIGIAD